MEKFDDILARYNIEVDIATKLFRKFKEKPIMHKNYPPVAGAIGWAQALYLQVKKPIMRFRTMESLLKSDRGEVVKAKYIELARSIDQYVQNHYRHWVSNVAEVAMINLRVPVLGPTATLGPNEEIQVPSRHDGLEIEAWVALPHGFEANGRAPMILEIHGGPFAMYGPYFASEIQRFAQPAQGDARRLHQCAHPRPAAQHDGADAQREWHPHGR